jgi:hypothetical protein
MDDLVYGKYERVPNDFKDVYSFHNPKAKDLETFEVEKANLKTEGGD